MRLVLYASALDGERLVSAVPAAPPQLCTYPSLSSLTHSIDLAIITSTYLADLICLQMVKQK